MYTSGSGERISSSELLVSIRLFLQSVSSFDEAPVAFCPVARARREGGRLLPAYVSVPQALLRGAAKDAGGRGLAEVAGTPRTGGHYSATLWSDNSGQDHLVHPQLGDGRHAAAYAGLVLRRIGVSTATFPVSQATPSTTLSAWRRQSATRSASLSSERCVTAYVWDRECGRLRHAGPTSVFACLL